MYDFRTIVHLGDLQLGFLFPHDAVDHAIEPGRHHRENPPHLADWV